MKKIILLENIRRTALKDTGTTEQNQRLTLKFVETVVAGMYADVLQMLIKTESDLDFFSKSYYDVDIQYDRDNNEYFSELPVRIVQMNNNNGIVLIKGKGSNRKFFKSSNTDIDIHTDTDVATYYDRTLFVSDGSTKIRYVSFDYGSHNIRKVTMKLIPDFMEYGFNDDVVLPSGRITDFVNLVARALFQNKKQLDTSSDSNPT